MKRLNDVFDRVADKVADQVAGALFFVFCLLLVLAWVAGLPVAGLTSQIYHLALNSPTTAITFLLVALLHNVQHRAERAVHRKLDVLMRVARKQCRSRPLCDELDDLLGTEAVPSKE